MDYLTTLCLSFCTCNMQIIIVLVLRAGLGECQLCVIRVWIYVDVCVGVQVTDTVLAAVTETDTTVVWIT